MSMGKPTNEEREALKEAQMRLTALTGFPYDRLPSRFKKDLETVLIWTDYFVKCAEKREPAWDVEFP